MKISSVIALFAVIYLSHSAASSNFTTSQFGAGHEPQIHVPVKPMSRLRSWLRPKRTTDAGRSQTLRPTVHPIYTTQSRPVNHYSTRRSDFKMGPLYNFIFRKQSTVHSGQATTPRGINPLATEIKRAYQTTEHAVSSGHHGASIGHNLDTARHSDEVNRSLLVTGDKNIASTKSHPATSGHPTATTARRIATARYIHNLTENHRITTEKSSNGNNRTSTNSKPQNSTFEFDVSIVNQISTSNSYCTSFICDDGHTLAGDSFVCDGVDDCIDGSDEIDADGNNCSDTKTLCWGGICINRYMQDVFAKYCEPTPQPEVEVSTITTTACLSDSDYMCANKAQCVSSSDICDGEADCDDGSDESACPCKGFQCGNGNCVSATAACNGVDDCGDSSDESSPTCPLNTNRRSCGDYFASGRFHCNNGYCVEKSSVCDGVSDCGDQTDENDARCNTVPTVPSCGPTHYVCSNQNCVTKDKICDDSDDCGDNSDEDFCDFNSGSGFSDPALVYSFAGAGGLILLIILIALVAHCHKRKTPTRRAIQRSPVLNMPVPPPSYEESRTNTQHNGVSFENPLSELKARF